MPTNTNSIVISGNLVRDPELAYLPSGTAVAKFTVANNRHYKSGGEKKKDVYYFDISAFGKIGEIVAEYARKGNYIIVTGWIKQERWESDKGKRQAVRIVADNVELGPRREKPEAETGQTDDDPF